MPGAGQVADARTAATQIVAAATALALTGFPAERELNEWFAAEERRRHADMQRVVPVFPSRSHFAGVIVPRAANAGRPRSDRAS